MEKQNEDNHRKSYSNLQLENRWKNINLSYRQRYPNLTENDVNFREGEYDIGSRRVAERNNKSRD